jgi:hypothetical protein
MVFIGIPFHGIRLQRFRFPESPALPFPQDAGSAGSLPGMAARRHRAWVEIALSNW